MPRQLVSGLLTYAALNAAIGVAAAALGMLGALGSSEIAFTRHLVLAVGFGAVGWALLRGARRDERARALAAALIAIATSYGFRPTSLLASAAPAVVGATLAVLQHFPADAFLPFLLWLFMRDFPRALQRRWSRAIGQVGVGASAIAGVALLGLNALRLVPSLAEAPVLALFSRADQSSQYWTISYGLVLPALGFAFWNARFARVEERRRVTWFLAGLIAAGVPIIAFILLGALSPAFADFVRSPRGQSTVLPIVQLLILSLPITTAYAVLVKHVLDVRLVIRKALQYGLARSLVMLSAVAPFAWVAWRVFSLRGEPISALGEGWRPVVLGLPLVAGALALWLRGPAIRALDRLFFREQADARELLSALGEKTSAARDARELAELLTLEIDRALHLRTLALLVADSARAELVTRSGVARSIGLSSGLALLARASRAPLDLDLEDPTPGVASLAVEERQWIADGGFELLVPLLGSDGELLGCIALGEKRSELDFSREDRLLLSAIAGAAALALETRLLRQVGGVSGASARDEAARECARCGAVSDPEARVCAACSGELVAASVPYVLAGKFRLERRVGEGGMGVVYRARDLDLQRTVAIKTLPRTSPEGSVRLRREARAMAAVQHAHLALIYGAETWRATPLLVVEFLAGGTLADRLRDTRLTAADTVQLGLVLADVLARIHDGGVLHRDVKPSNIGYTIDGVAKLLDFGLAQMVQDSLYGSERALERGRGLGAREVTGPGSTLVSEGIVGTPLYMSPEALWGETPDASFDLWSAAIVLYEAIAGRNPFQRATWGETLDAITNAHAPDVREHARRCPAALAELLAACLSRDRRQRPADARELAQRLRGVLAAITPARAA